MSEKPPKSDSGTVPLGGSHPSEDDSDSLHKINLPSSSTENIDQGTDCIENQSSEEGSKPISYTYPLKEEQQRQDNQHEERTEPIVVDGQTLNIDDREPIPFPAPEEEGKVQKTVQTEGNNAKDPDRPTIAGYEVLGELGRGGMGVVYKARQVGLNRLVALKMVLAGSHASKKDRARFQLEAEAVARLHHPNIIQIYEVGEQGGYPFISFEYVDGGSLASRLRGTPLPEKQAALLVEIVARAVHAAHQRDIIHRDLKPANILLLISEDPKSDAGASGTAQLSEDQHSLTSVMPKVSDFGLAKNLQLDSGQTGSGDVMGTPSYMAPEQAAGKINELGPAVDIYALGAILYELLVGKPPFRGESAWETIREVINNEPVSPRRIRPSVSRDLETICLKCLHKEPDRRYATAIDFAEDLRRFRNGENIKARPVGSVERVIKWSKRNPTIASLVVTVLLLAIGSGLALTGLWLRADHQRKQAEIQKEEAERQKEEANFQRNEAIKHKERAQQAQKQTKRAYLQSQLQSYAAHMQEAQTAYREGDFQRAHEVLNSLIPAKNEDNDLRGFEWRLLKHLCSDQRSTSQHARLISDVAFTRDAKRMATASFDKTVRIWDLRTGTEIAKLDEHTEPIRTIAFSPDGTLLASGSEDRTIRIWDAIKGKRLAVLKGHEDQVTSLAFHPEGTELISGSDDGVVYHWNVSEKKAIQHFQAHDYGVTCVAFDHKGSTIATGGLDKAIYLWSTMSGKRLQSFTEHEGAIVSLAFDDNGKWLASAGTDRAVRLWDLQTNQQNWRFSLNAQPEKILFDQRGRTLAMLSQDGQLQAWNILTRRELELNRQSTPLLGLAFHPDGRLLESIEFSFRSSLPKSMPIDEGHSDAVLAIDLSPDGQLLASAGQDHRVILWNVEDLERTHLLLKHSEPVHCVAFSNDGKQLASAGRDGIIRIWNPNSGELLQSLHGTKRWIHTVAFIRDGTELLSAGEDHVVTRWNLTTGKVLSQYQKHQQAITSLVVPPDAKKIISVDKGGIVHIWDRLTGDTLQKFQAHQGRVLDVCLDAKCNRMVTAGWDQTIKLWNLEDQSEEQIFHGHAYRVHAVTFSADERRLVSTGEDKTIKIWDVQSGRELLTLKQHELGVTDIACADTGELLISSGRDGRILLWPAPKANSSQHQQ